MRADSYYLDHDEWFEFPPVEKATEEGIVAAGGNLSPGMLISAYSQGIFPWFGERDPLLWWSPDPRFVLYPNNVHISKTMLKILRKGVFDFSVDYAFPQVIFKCAKIPRLGQRGTWITKSMIDAYTTLHELGYSHSVEVWRENSLVGGLYGVSIGRFFFGESMFFKESNASKAALIVLAWKLSDFDFIFIDCQIYTKHLESLGARLISRRDFIQELKKGIKSKTYKGSWNDVFEDFPLSDNYRRIVWTN